MEIAKAGKQYLRRLAYRAHRAQLSLRRRPFSAFNEEGILRRYITQLLPPDHGRFAVDIGAGDGIRHSNTYALFSRGWSGIGVECDGRKACKLARAYKHYPNVSACRCRVTPNNVAPLLHAYAVEPEFSVLSLDLDGNDYWVLDELLHHFRPRLIITELNEKIPPPIKFVVKYNPDFQLRHHFYGYSVATLGELTKKHGYGILQLEYNNAFLAPAELPGVRPLEVAAAYHEGYAKRADRKEKFPPNHDMEILQSLSPAEGVSFLKQFYSNFENEYELSIGE